MISVKLREPQFEGQTKTKLGNASVRGLVEQTVNVKLAEFLEENGTEAKQIINKALAARNARRGGAQSVELTRRKRRPRQHVAARQARRLLGSTTPSLRSSTSWRGTRPAAPPIDARDRTFQAILPLRGKVINSEKNRINKVLSNVEIQSMITAVGTGIGMEFDIEKLRYHRIIVMTDADVDESHIRTLILTFLYRQMQELVEGGYVYIAVHRVKIGSREQYIEKESLFEDLLVREKVKDIDVSARGGEPQKLTEAKYARFTKALNEFEGWTSRLRADFGRPRRTSSSRADRVRPRGREGLRRDAGGAG